MMVSPMVRGIDVPATATRPAEKDRDDHARIASSIVAGSGDASTSVTGRCKVIEVPKSPVTCPYPNPKLRGERRVEPVMGFQRGDIGRPGAGRDRSSPPGRRARRAAGQTPPPPRPRASAAPWPGDGDDCKQHQRSLTAASKADRVDGRRAPARRGPLRRQPGGFRHQRRPGLESRRKRFGVTLRSDP